MQDPPFDGTTEEEGAPELPLLDQAGDLWFAGQCIRPHRRPAKNQDLILRAFQEDDWPPRIDDPLPGGCDDPRARLHDGLRQLNASLHPPLIKFSRDGTGQGIRWRVEDETKPTDPAG